MEAFCRKYREPVPEEKVECRHLRDYCKFRTSCIVFFMSREDEDEEQDEREEAGADRMSE